MKTESARRDIHAAIATDIRRCSEATSRATHRDETVWENWEHLMRTCQFRRARQWWLEEIAPAFRQQ